MLNKGTYQAKLRGTAIIYYAGKDDQPEDGRALMGLLPMIVVEGESVGQTIDATVCFVSKDGTVQTRAIDNMREVFGMPGANPFWLQFANPDACDDNRERDLTSIMFNIVVEHEEYNNKVRAKVQWINPLGRDGGWTPKPADRRSVLAKYGSKFRALSGGSPAKPAAPAAPTAPKPPTPPAPPAPSVPPATMDEAWEACCNNNKGREEAVWFQVIEQMFPGRGNNLTPAEWGQLKAKFTDNVPA